MLMGQVERDAPKDLLVPREGRLIPISRPSAINAVGTTPYARAAPQGQAVENNLLHRQYTMVVLGRYSSDSADPIYCRVWVNHLIAILLRPRRAICSVAIRERIVYIK